MRSLTIIRTARGQLPYAMLLIALVVIGCGGDDSTTSPTQPSTAAENTTLGWAHFAAGQYGNALASFQAALGADATYGPAHTGMGWTHLQQATSPSAMLAAVGNFDAAAANGEAGADMLAGRAAAKLGVGGASLTGAVTDAEAALAASPGFVFAHRASINASDLRLMVAFAQVAQNNFAAALATADQMIASGIVESQPATWVVGSTTYPSFVTAVMAHLHTLSEDHAG